MEITTGRLAEKLGAELKGDPEIVLTGMASIESAGTGDLAFLANSKYYKYLETTRASAIIVSPEVVEAPATLIVHPQPYFIFAQALRLFYADGDQHEPGIHDSSVIGENCEISSTAYVGPSVVIEDGVTIGEKTQVLAGCFVGRGCLIGAECRLFPNVTLRAGSKLGDRVQIHSGTVVGSDGFGYAQVNGHHHKIPQVGIVVIEDDVEIGSNCSIDKAALGETRIGRGTKIDNLVQIAHNVKIGQNCIVVSQVGISGSTKLGNNVILAGQVGLVGHIEIGDNVMVAAQSGVNKSLEADKAYFGSPATEIMHQKRIEASTKKLPELIRRVRKLEKQLIEKNSEKTNE
ncbi:MAG: UDP-3-O-(3-hydroxymyristoyl)glucosamine N-acyltransferase [candidate division Zixibacteria bacterium]|nr:UDP-3-O-(3-hydroxymyristoyl)glucosamine N-acyltransferase [candidate division Zixibacteria bacterium]